MKMCLAGLLSFTMIIGSLVCQPVSANSEVDALKVALLNSNRSFWDKMNGVKFEQFANGVLYRVYENDPITGKPHYVVVSHREFQKRLPGVPAGGLRMNTRGAAGVGTLLTLAGVAGAVTQVLSSEKETDRVSKKLIAPAFADSHSNGSLTVSGSAK